MAKIEETQVNQVVKDTFDSQINEVNSDIHTLLMDTGDKLNSHIKEATTAITALTKKFKLPNTANQQSPTLNTYAMALPTSNTYMSALINPPPMLTHY